jgi:fibronectin type 3 domain-containing protein
LFCIYNTFIASAIEVPSNAEAINVTDYGANGNDTIDDTEAIQQAIDDNWAFYGGHENNFRFLYIPDGTYIVSGQIYWKRWLVFQGESESGTIIKLKDNCEGFTDAGSPKAVLRCHRNVNTSFSNYIQDLTVNTGSGNPGAIGVSYGQHNMGAMRNVSITSETGSIIGLDLSETEFGPGLVKDVTIDNFETGIMTPANVSHATLEHITVKNCELALNCNFPMSIRDLEVIDCEQGITNTNTLSQLVLIDATFTGGSGSYSAIENTKSMYLRNITSSGFQSALEDSGEVVPGNTIEERLSGENIDEALPSPDEHLKLPVEDPIEFTEDASNWVFVDPSADDDTKNIQDAIDSGAETIYLSFTGDYTISSPIYVRDSVKRILGFNTAIKGSSSDFDNGEIPMIVFQNTVPVTVDFLRLSNWPQTPSILIDTDQQVFLKSSRPGDVRNSSNAEGGKLFIEDCFVNIFLDNPQNTWARHLNQENNPYSSADLSRIYNINRGGNLWVLGHKTESIATHVLTTEAGKTEILGGFYRDHFPNDTIPNFITKDASISATYLSYSYDCCHNRTLHGVEIVGGDTSEYRPGMGTQAITLYSGFDTTVTIPSPPSDLNADSAGLYQVDIEWTNNATGTIGLVLERKVEDGSFTKIATLYDSTSYSDTGLTPLTKYTYRVKAFNRAGYSVYSNLDSTTTPIPDNPPIAPDSLMVSETSSSFILLNWNDNAEFEDSVMVEGKPTDSAEYNLIATLGRNATSYRDLGLSPNTSYTYRVRAWNLAGYSDYTQEVTAETDSALTGWEALDINSDGGATTQNGGVMSITGEGWDIWGGNDAFRYVYTKRKNNYIEIFARVLSVQNTHEWAKAGVMIRQSTAKNAKFAHMCITPENGTSFQHRPWTGANADDITPEDGAEAPYWLRLVKQGNTYTGYTSTEGQEWTEIGSVDLNMTDSLHVGMAVTSHSGGDFCTAEFDNITIIASGIPVPAKPGINAEAVSPTRVDLSFSDNSDNEEGFILQRKTDGNEFMTIDTLGMDTIDYSDTGLDPLTMYSYRVAAYNETGNSNWSSTVTPPLYVPEIPDGIMAEAVSTSQINLSWNDSSEYENGFIIRQSKESDPYEIIDTTSANTTSYQVTGLDAGTRYSFMVRASSLSGPSDWSEEVSDTTIDVLPEAPDGLTGMVVSLNQIDLQWNDNSDNEDGFIIQRKTGDGAFATIDTVEAGATTYSDTDVQASRSYTYRLSSYNPVGHSAWTEEFQATTLPTVPDAPGGLMADSAGSNHVDLSWNDNSDNEEGFILQRKEGNTTFSTIDSLDAGMTSYSDTGLAASQDYSYRVMAYNISGNSSWSNELAVTTLMQTDILTGKPESMIKIFPNPLNSEVLTINLPYHTGKTNIIIRDMNNRLVYQSTNNNNLVKIQSNQFRVSGMYIISIIADNFIIHKKLIIH